MTKRTVQQASHYVFYYLLSYVDLFYLYWNIEQIFPYAIFFLHFSKVS